MGNLLPLRTTRRSAGWLLACAAFVVVWSSETRCHAACGDYLWDATAHERGLAFPALPADLQAVLDPWAPAHDRSCDGPGCRQSSDGGLGMPASPRSQTSPLAVADASSSLAMMPPAPGDRLLFDSDPPGTRTEDPLLRPPRFL